MLLRSVRLATLVLLGLMLGPGFAHVLEMGPKLELSAHEYYLVQSIYTAFGPAGAVLAPASIVAAIVAAVLARHRRGFTPAIVSAIAAALALASWFALVAPMNQEMATWADGIPADWAATRRQWEYGHAVGFALQLVAFVATAVAILVEVPTAETRYRRGIVGGLLEPATRHRR
jgi:hypothetical protein